MRILFDNGTPKPIANALKGHQVSHARQLGWHELANGELIEKAELAGYDVFLSTDKISGTSKTSRRAKLP